MKSEKIVGKNYCALSINTFRCEDKRSPYTAHGLISIGKNDKVLHKKIIGQTL